MGSRCSGYTLISLFDYVSIIFKSWLIVWLYSLSFKVFPMKTWLLFALFGIYNAELYILALLWILKTMTVTARKIQPTIAKYWQDFCIHSKVEIKESVKLFSLESSLNYLLQLSPDLFFLLQYHSVKGLIRTA